MYSKRATPTILVQAAGAPPLSNRASQAHACWPSTDGRPSWDQQPTPCRASRGTGQDRRPEGAVQGQGHLGTRVRPKWRIACASSRCSTWASIASFEVAISSRQGARCLPRRRCGQPRGSHAAKTQRPVQFEITSATREAVQRWIKQAGLRSDGFLPKSHALLAASWDATVRPDLGRLGGGTRP